ncbi:hypothetical protein LJC17_01505 [Acholeplasma sp. OttesenSCG-928-E16]|nr:hypothetical protein [Acholeplasma sp. OttesenSCG-928-E16]
MLRKITKKEFDVYVDYIYKLTQQFETSSFPTYLDGIKTKEDFFEDSKNGMEREDEVILLYLNSNNIVKGWIHFFFEPNELYLETRSFCIDGYYDEAVDDFQKYLINDFYNYEISIGLPNQNTSAISSFLKSDYKIIEETDVMIARINRNTPHYFNNELYYITKKTSKILKMFISKVMRICIGLQLESKIDLAYGLFLEIGI